MSAEQIQEIQALWDRMQGNEDPPAELKKVSEHIKELISTQQ